MSIPRLLIAFLLVSAVARPALAGAPKTEAPKATTPNTPCCLPYEDYDQDGIQDRLDHCNNTPKGCIIDQYGCSTDADGDGVCDGIDECPNTPKGEKVNKVGCSENQLAHAQTPPPPPPVAAPPVVAPPVTPPPAPEPVRTEVEKQLVETGRIVLTDVYFELNKATLLPESEARLNEAGAALEKYPALKVEVGGHTDSRGSAAYNQRLSQSRAESVRTYLLSHYKLEAGNVTAKGYGESQLAVSPEKSDGDYAKNRRVVLRAINAEVLPGNVKLEQHNN